MRRLFDLRGLEPRASAAWSALLTVTHAAGQATTAPTGAQAAGALVLSLLCLVTGCAPERATTTSKTGIAELHIVTVPVALNMDPQPGADGFALKVYASDAVRPKPKPIARGTVEILMFDGVVKEAALTTQPPRRVWTFSLAELRAVEFKTSIGVGYQFALKWGEAAPSGNRITVAARYLPREGTAIYSTPSAISIDMP